jgi:hypothetical protein
LLEGKKYIVRSGAVVSGILDMRRGKHLLYFVVDGELLPHAIVNIPDNENIHVGVRCFIYLFFYILLFCLYFFHI